MANPFAAGGKADALLQAQLPKIRELFAAKVGPALTSVAKNDDKLKVLSGTVYALLPAVVRFAVKEDAFVKFCLGQRDKLLPPRPPTNAPVADLTVPAETTLYLADGPVTYRIAKDGEELGSLTESALRKIIIAGALSLQDYYLEPASNEWVALEKFPWSE